ncbi:class I SAM-dependent methyltransferase [Rhodospirillaceae bacterium KN72]|uniref:Class I SAM-dependent methyltransferase n=2 Tax=Pacificispira spongiicola TaxID=2729598 RepID=A0A7Y0E3R5_9PROT|nr:class I SAM-dependent methyltransferase [Pacificispira spongiicola]
MAEKEKGEIQYQEAIDLMRKLGLQKLGLTSSWGFYDDPKRLTFTLARYKFVSKMLEGRRNVLELGCGDAFASRIVRQAVGKLTAFDFDQDFVESAREIMSDRWQFDVRMHDILDGPVPVSEDGLYDAAYSMDVMEHIPAEQEHLYFENIIASLDEHGVLIVGAPSLESQEYASPHSKVGHVNCKNQRDLKASLEKYFHNVFTFSMNDEVVHTGFHKMSHYNLALGCGKKR